MPRREFCRPELVGAVGGEGVLPDVADIQRVRDDSLPDFLAEQALEQILIQRERALRKDRIAALLQFVGNAQVDARIVMIGPSQQDNPHSPFSLQSVEDLARLAPYIRPRSDSAPRSPA